MPNGPPVATSITAVDGGLLAEQHGERVGVAVGAAAHVGKMTHGKPFDQEATG